MLDADLAATGRLLLFHCVFGIAGALFLTRGGNRIGKHRRWAVSILYSLVTFFPAWFLGRGHTGYSVPALFHRSRDRQRWHSRCFDVRRRDRYRYAAQRRTEAANRSGEQRDALFMALWALAGKFAAALGAGIALPLLESSGFRLTTGGGRRPRQPQLPLRRFPDHVPAGGGGLRVAPASARDQPFRDVRFGIPGFKCGFPHALIRELLPPINLGSR